jgi:hypothetical protein
MAGNPWPAHASGANHGVVRSEEPTPALPTRAPKAGGIFQHCRVRAANARQTRRPGSLPAQIPPEHVAAVALRSLPGEIPRPSTGVTHTAAETRFGICAGHRMIH